MKIDRMLAMTVLLLNRGRISAKELADRFEVSTKTIYRDMDTLSRAGIPIAAYSGTSGGFEIMEQYTISRQFLTLDEIYSIFAAVKGVKAALDDQTLDGLLDKVETLLYRSRQEKEVGHSVSAELLFDLNPWGQGVNTRGKVSQLRQAIGQSRKVKLQYINMNGSDSEREVEPCRLILKGNVWYLQAYCLLREDFRSFRLSRIQEIDVFEAHFTPRKLPLQDTYDWKPEWSSDARKSTVRLLFSPLVRHRVWDTFAPDQISLYDDGSVCVEGEFSLDEWFYGMVLSYGGHIKIESPEFVAEEVVRRAQKILDLYSKPNNMVST
ncbi:helix-turn-helix transcriptional regulator [Paenibacillus azoreducens]|uniref:Transcriptional regulator n=1 Tax=Paenibacillus azoreducens TaxID=116718 RepID=A0A919YHV8_9BACL|nr:YafY family protein [Paenibacillus azoreducens]GIO51497.1 transcriptional regulator [Paenibacillus azoreducens]